MVNQQGPGVKATCPNGHRIYLYPVDSVFGFWLCPKCGSRYFHSQWKYLVWGPRLRLERMPKEIADGYKPNKWNNIQQLTRAHLKATRLRAQVVGITIHLRVSW